MVDASAAAMLLSDGATRFSEYENATRYTLLIPSVVQPADRMPGGEICTYQYYYNLVRELQFGLLVITMLPMIRIINT